MPATLSAKFRDSERDLTWALPAADDPTALVALTCGVEGAGEVGREGRLRIGRVRSAFILNVFYRVQGRVVEAWMIRCRRMSV